jgi:hypothetical protein
MGIAGFGPGAFPTRRHRFRYSVFCLSLCGCVPLSLGCALSGMGLYSPYIVTFLVVASLLGFAEMRLFMAVWESRELGAALEGEGSKELFVAHVVHKTKKSFFLMLFFMACMAVPFAIMIASDDQEQGRVGVVGLVSFSLFQACFGPMLGVWEAVMLTHRESTLNRMQEYVSAVSSVLFDSSSTPIQAVDDLSLLWRLEGRVIEYNLHRVWSRMASLGAFSAVLANIGYCIVLFLAPLTHEAVVPEEGRYVLGTLVMLGGLDGIRMYFEVASEPYKAGRKLTTALKDPKNLLVAAEKFGGAETLLSWIETQDLKLYIGHIPVDDTLGGRVIAAMISFFAFVAIILVEKKDDFLNIF